MIPGSSRPWPQQPVRQLAGQSLVSYVTVKASPTCLRRCGRLGPDHNDLAQLAVQDGADVLIVQVRVESALTAGNNRGHEAREQLTQPTYRQTNTIHHQQPASFG